MYLLIYNFMSVLFTLGWSPASPARPKFQGELDALLSEYPMPVSITQMHFREARWL